jgi:NADH dehydrogenase
MSNAAAQEPAIKKHVVIVGGGFAGLNCARKSASHSDVRITPGKRSVPEAAHYL